MSALNPGVALTPGLARSDRRVTAARTLRTLVRRPTFVASCVVLLFWLAAPLIVLITGLDPDAAAGVPNQPPSPQHWLGVDNLGRDELTRVLAGASSTLLVAPAATALATVLGTALGLLAGYYRGFADDLLMRSFDLLNALPGIVAVLLVAIAFGESPATLIVAIGLFFTPLIARTVRSAVLVEMGKQYVEAAITQGESTRRVLFAELLPNVAPALIVEATIRLGYAVFVAAGLSFLGVGAQPPSSDWGLAVAENRIFLQTAWWSAAFPALAIISLVVAVNLIADNLREVLDP
ncbi:ABC transporter permease [Herbiconiux sp. CPCC 205763]|uniref:ABC transporter permease n=1 Tax=Herbiconiux aconitum TaxID=2970913 RepID=A0ABT2GND3_9MICO|nr:ABC transporter permease [Herbiconiux aconitum]MCS5717729.1 ABC transporter permease [Herbiconiux aconitum]